MSGIFAIDVLKCRHTEKNKHSFEVLDLNTTFGAVFRQFHGDFDAVKFEAVIQVSNATASMASACSSSGADSGWRDVGFEVSISLLSGFNINSIRLKCIERPEIAEEDLDIDYHDAKPKKNALSILMLPQERVFVQQKESPSAPTSTGTTKRKGSLTKKDDLYNDVATLLQQRGLSFYSQIVNSEGTHIVQVLCNVLWYITNHHETINKTAVHRASVTTVPPAFAKFIGYNDVKKKKVKNHPINSQQLKNHSQVLYGLCTRPSMSKTVEWSDFSANVKALADCLSNYAEYLQHQTKVQFDNRQKLHPVRSVSEDATVEHRLKTVHTVKSLFEKLDSVVVAAGLNNPVFFDESLHLDAPFTNYMQRFRFTSVLQLSVPIALVRYCPGGGHITSLIITQVAENRSPSEQLTEASQMLVSVKPKLKEFHTRMQRKLFKEQLSRVAGVRPAVADLIYKELALDASVADHPETQQRLHLIFMGEEGLLADLRHLNPGRPGGIFDTFFEKLGEIVEKHTAADERRHNISHLSSWISMKDMIKEAQGLCTDMTEGTPIPSSSLVRLQFAPRNPYTHAALSFTNKIEVQYKIQRRQLRAVHVDDHYCAALFKYLKCMAIEMSPSCSLFCCDDKAKVPIGDPGVHVSTGVRGKKTLAPTGTTLVALDHDMTKASMTPSVYLNCALPDSPAKSFVRGQVSVVVNDSVLQASSPFRHAAVQMKLIQKELDPGKTVLLKYTDGGTDQRNNLESVIICNIVVFKELGLDMLVHCRCAPGHSWMNPAERIMSLLNLGLQNCSLARESCDEEGEKKLKSCGSMAAVRTAVEKEPSLGDKWTEAVKVPRELVGERFSRLSLKGEPVCVLEPVSSAEIDHVLQIITKLFPGMETSKFQKAHTKKNQLYQTWLSNHCRLRHYSFQIRKCEDEQCCTPPRLPREALVWLPDPVLDETGEHYCPYSSVKGLETTEEDLLQG